MESKIKLVYKNSNSVEEFNVKNGENLKNILTNRKVVDFPCSGKGICGKCKIEIKEDVEYTERELEILSSNEIKAKVHLGCMINVDRDLTVYVEEGKNFSVLTETDTRNVELNTGIEFLEVDIKSMKKGHSTLSNSQVLEEYLRKLGKRINKSNIKLLKDLHMIYNNDKEYRLLIKDNEVIKIISEDLKSYGIAVDIGTTTIAMYLYNLVTGDHIDSFSGINPQRRFGHDVISRISYADSKEKLEELRNIIVLELTNMMKHLLNKHNIDFENLHNMIIAANTTMNHLLIGADVSAFGKSPFAPQFLDMIKVKAEEIGINNFDYLDLIILNNMSSFVGGDLVAGIVDTDLDIHEEQNLLIDIGTNGEIILGNKDKIICCATAAGPAFEAVNISCGIGSVNGAICKVYKENSEIKYNTIGDEAPIGICGTGLIDLIAYLLDEEIIDEVGYMEDDFVICKSEAGEDIFISPKDIREIQLAKAAIRAGIDCLIEESGLKIGDINNIFIAGGFGNYLNLDSAIKIGLIPDVKEKLVTVGNSAGSGACKILLDNRLLDRAEKINNKFTYIELSSDKKFMEKYVDNMMF